LHQAILPLQKNQVAVGVGRLALTALTMFVFPWAFIGVLAAGIPRIFGNIYLRKISYDFADKDQKPDKEIRSEILALVKKIMPTSIYYCVSGQITIWLISIFGNTTSLAQLGALGRLGVILSVFSTMIIVLVVPRFAKLAINKKVLLKRFVQIVAIIVVFLSSIVFTVYTFPKPILWLLGDAYKGLPYELVLSIIGSCIGLLSGIVFQLYSSRGWAMSPFLMISLNVLAIIALASILDLSNLKGVLYFEIWLSTIIFFQLSLFSIYKILKL
jgi:O-antigen/teichoic acid export membrane protein